MKTCISDNSKTIHSVDFTTDCPKRREGKPCKYCYVESARDRKYNAKAVYNATYQGEIKKFTSSKIAKLNAVGGLRLFSFGDYMPEHEADCRAFLDDALTMGLKVKAITKQPAFVETFADHPAMAVTHVSIDNVGDGMAWSTAAELKAKHSKVLIRSAVMVKEDLEALPVCDIYTFNHAPLKAKHGYSSFNGKHRALFNSEGVAKGKTCCVSSSCTTCELKCGLK